MSLQAEHDATLQKTQAEHAAALQAERSEQSATVVRLRAGFEEEHAVLCQDFGVAPPRPPRPRHAACGAVSRHCACGDVGRHRPRVLRLWRQRSRGCRPSTMPRCRRHAANTMPKLRSCRLGSRNSVRCIAKILASHRLPGISTALGPTADLSKLWAKASQRRKKALGQGVAAY